MSAISKARLRAFFAHFSKLSAKLPKAEGNRYESFVFLETCASARRVRLNVQLVSSGKVFVFRASPGNLGGSFGYAKFQSSSGRTYQLHNGIELIGHSRMQHEIDVLLLNDLNRLPVKRAHGLPLALAIECKFYDAANRLKGEVRRAVGAVTDFAENAHPSQLTGAPQGCLHCGKGFDAIFATSVRRALRPDLERFLATYDIAACFGATPRGGGLNAFRQTLDTVLSRLP